MGLASKKALHIVRDRAKEQERRRQRAARQAEVVRDYSTGMRFFRELWGVVVAMEKFAPFVGASPRHVRGRLFGDRNIRAEVTDDEVKNAGWGLVCALRWEAEYMRKRADEIDAAAEERAQQLRSGRDDCALAHGACG